MTFRIAIGGILHETHTFAPAKTGMHDFETLGIYRGERLLGQRGKQSALGGMLDRLAEMDVQVVPLLVASALPGGIVEKETYRTLLKGLLSALEENLPVDGVILSLHGAMVAEGQLDCEGDILANIRRLIGQNCPVVATLDMHGNVSQTMVEEADVLVGFRCNPHLDAYDRGIEAVNILNELVHSTVPMTSAIVHPPLVLNALNTWTDKNPLLAVHQAAKEYLRDDRLVNISVMGGFGYADTPFTGMSVLVTTRGDTILASKVAHDLGRIAWQHRQAAGYLGVDPYEAVVRAMNAKKRPVILADVGDNIGGGAPGDGTVILRALLDLSAQDAVVVIADKQAATMARDAGIGARIEVKIGGKEDRLHGDPILIQGTVENITDGQFHITGKDHFANLYGSVVNMGLCAVIRCKGVRILLTSNRTPPGDLNQLRSQGIEPTSQAILVVKSAVAFRGAYGPIAGEIIEVNTPGLCTSDLRKFHYRYLPRPVYPLDGDAAKF